MGGSLYHTQSLQPSFLGMAVLLWILPMVALRVCNGAETGRLGSTERTLDPGGSTASLSSSTNTEDPVELGFEEWLRLWHDPPSTNDDDDASPSFPYDTLVEYTARKTIYQANLARWKALNRIPGGARYGPASEPYADRTPDEFAETVASCYRERHSTDKSPTGLRTAYSSSLNPPLPRRARNLRANAATTTAVTTHHQPVSKPFTIMDVDWRSHAPPPSTSSSSSWISYVTPVKNQGPHGTCWSFAVAENLEGLAVRQGHGLQAISEQEFVSCCANCRGRAGDVSFDWLLRTTGGVPALEDGYPYDGNSSVPCRVDTAPRANLTLHAWARVVDTDGTGAAIVDALRAHGPMGVGVDARCFHGYKSGIVRACDPGDKRPGVNHAVLVVAAGTDLRYAAAASSRTHPPPGDDEKPDEDDDGTTSRGGLSFPTPVDFYAIKNSWGPQWGEDGYVRIERGTNWWGPIDVIYTE